MCAAAAYLVAGVAPPPLTQHHHRPRQAPLRPRSSPPGLAPRVSAAPACRCSLSGWQVTDCCRRSCKRSQTASAAWTAGAHRGLEVASAWLLLLFLHSTVPSVRAGACERDAASSLTPKDRQAGQGRAQPWTARSLQLRQMHSLTSANACPSTPRRHPLRPHIVGLHHHLHPPGPRHHLHLRQPGLRLVVLRRRPAGKAL